MNPAFDPYYKWLGIAPEEQPPNHYRLLGIRVFEEDPDVIEAAADQRMAHLRNYQAGKHSELSQKLLNEVAAAKICLLNRQKRGAYDANLRAELEANAAQVAPLGPVAIDPALADLFQTIEPAKGTPLPSAKRKNPSSNATVLLAMSAIGGLLVLGLVVWNATRSDPNPAKPTMVSNAPAVKPAAPEPPTTPKAPGAMPQEPTAAPKTAEKLSAEKPPEAEPSPPVPTEPIVPLDPATVRAQQQRGARERGVPVEIANSIGMRLVFVPAGEFEMGSPSDQIEQWLGELKDKRFDWHRHQLPMEAPPHRVGITQPFYLGVYEVTQVEYQQIIGHNPSAFSTDGKEKAKVDGQDTRRHPVENVNWQDAIDFCQKLSARPAEQAAGRVYRLPTEAEWEYACRAGTRTQWHCGDGPASLPNMAWFAGCNSGMTHPVGQKSPNGLGVYDLHGNVSEWCMDWFAPDYYAQSHPNDPQGPSSGLGRTVRGGAWWAEAVACRSAFRHGADPAMRHYVQGFRVVCTPGKAMPQPPDAQPQQTDQPAVSTPNKTASNVTQPNASALSPTKRLPLPSEEVQQKLLRQVDEVYKLGEAKTGAQKLKLARDLLNLGRKSESEPTERFVFLRRAMETASDGGDAALMLQAVNAIAALFDVDRLAVQAKVLLKFAEEAGDSAAIKSFVDSSREVIDRALAEDRYEPALNLATAAYHLSMKPAGREYRKPTYDRRQEIQALVDQWKKLEEARATLTERPDDPAANQALGSWLCLEKGDWAAGLPHLAKGSDESLKRLASEELSSSPTSTEAQLKLADAWWNLAESRKGREKDSLLLHAASWYQAAHAATTGLVRVKVDKRLAEATKLGRPIPKLPSRQLPPLAVAPFSAAEAQQHQERWAKHLGMPAEWTNSIGMKLVLIPPGEFEMGASEEEIRHATLATESQDMPWASRLIRSEGPQEMPRHRVRITRPLLFGACEVTVGQFRRFVEATAYRTEAERDAKEERIFENNDWKHVTDISWRSPGSVQSEDSPVTLVSWNDAVAFCQWASRQEQVTCRLPTEAEWEYACRAGSNTPWTFGDREQDLGEYAWHLGNSGGQAHPVGQKKPNAWGLYDIHGNVSEWCADWLSGDYYRISPVDDPRGPATGNNRVFRGGRWHFWSLLHRSAFRLGYPPSSRNNTMGFRVVCESIRPGDAKASSAEK